MLKSRSDADLAEESISAQDRAELRVEDFEGDIPIVLGVAREKDRGHSTASDLSFENVRGTEAALQLIANSGHAEGGEVDPPM